MRHITANLFGIGLLAFAVGSTSALAQEVLPRPAPPFKGKIGRTATESTPDFPKAVTAPKGAPNVLLIMTDDVGFARIVHLRRRDSDADVRPAGQGRSALQHVPHHGALLADARGAHHRAQPSHQRHRRHHGNGHGLSRLQLADAEELRHGRRDPQAERLQHGVVRQEPQRARLAVEPGRAVRPLAHRPGLRVFLRLHRRRHRPVALRHLRRHQADRAPRSNAARIRSTSTRTGRPGDCVDSPATLARAGQAVLCVLRAGPDPCAAPRAEGVDREVQGPVRPGLGQAARGDARPPDPARASFPPAPSSPPRPKEIPAWDSLQRRPEASSTPT